MNKFLWISLTIVVVAGIGLLILSFTSKNIETPEYKVIKNYGLPSIAQLLPG